MFFQRLQRQTQPAVLAGLLCVTWLLLFGGELLAQDFEGVIKQRTITLRDEALQMLVDPIMEELYADDEYDEEEDLSDEAAEEQMGRELKRLAEKIFAIPVDQLLAAAQSDTELIDVTTYVKGSKIRSEVEEEGSPFSYMLADLESGTVLMVSTAGGYYVKWSAEEMKKMMAEMGFDPEATLDEKMEPAERPEVRDLGKSMDVNGMRCQAYEIVHEGGVSIGWLAAEHTALQRTVKSFSEKVDTMFGDSEDESDIDVEDLFWEKGLPVRIRSLEGDVYSGFSAYEVQDLISVESKSLSSDLFEVPAGYTEKSLRELWGQG